MKKILYINQYFRHPKEPGITRSYWIARELIKAGYDVTMLAHRNALLDFVENPPAVEKTTIDDIRVIYVRNEYDNSMGVIARSWSFLKFMFKSTYYALREKNVDLVIATSTPLTVAFPALMRKWFKKTPFIFEVRDLWPEGPIQMGGIKNQFVIKFLQWFEKTTYKNAIHVVALSPGMQEGVIKHIPKERTTMIPNMAKIDKFWPREKDVELMKAMGLKTKSFKVIYFGQMGLSNAIPYILETIIIINRQNANDIEFLFVGHGKFFKEIEGFAKNEGFKNIKVFGRKTMSEMSEIINFCDLSLVTFTNLPILYTNSPNKLFDSLSAGIPVIVNSPGWTKHMVETHQCGLFSDPEKPEDMAEKIIWLKENPKARDEMGKNARKLAETKYDKSILCKQFVDVVNQVFPEK